MPSPTTAKPADRVPAELMPLVSAVARGAADLQRLVETRGPARLAKPAAVMGRAADLMSRRLAGERRTSPPEAPARSFVRPADARPTMDDYRAIAAALATARGLAVDYWAALRKRWPRSDSRVVRSAAVVRRIDRLGFHLHVAMAQHHQGDASAEARLFLSARVPLN